MMMDWDELDALAKFVEFMDKNHSQPGALVFRTLVKNENGDHLGWVDWDADNGRHSFRPS